MVERVEGFWKVLEHTDSKLPLTARLLLPLPPCMLCILTSSSACMHGVHSSLVFFFHQKVTVLKGQIGYCTGSNHCNTLNIWQET